MVTVARLIRALTGLVVLVIVVGILLSVLSADPHTALVSDIHDAATWLVGPFQNVFSLKHPKLNLAVNWGLAAVIYAIVGGLLARSALAYVPSPIHRLGAGQPAGPGPRPAGPLRGSPAGGSQRRRG